MFVAKVKRVVGNPHRAKKRRKAVTGRKRSKANPKRRRVLSPKQIKHFGTPAQKAALKRSRAAKRGAKKRKANPVRRTVKRVKRRSVAKKRPAVRRRRRVTRNPAATLITLGFANPRKGKKSVARKRRKARKANSTRKRVVRRRRRSIANPIRRRRRARRNSTRVVVMSKRRNGRRRSSRRNPQFFGHTVPAVQMAKYVAGGLIGVTVVKAGVPMLPSALTGSTAMRAVSSIAVAFAAGWAASRLSPDFGSAVLFGGLMQAGSVVLNSYVPQASSFALAGGRGLGEFVPGAFTVPQNPVILSGPSRIGGAAGRPAVNRAYPRPY